MKYLCSCLFVLSAVVAAPADGPSLQSARQRWLRGNYDEARAQYDVLAKDTEQRDAWGHQLADTVSAAVQSGGYPDGVKRLDDLATRLDSNRRWT